MFFLWYEVVRTIDIQHGGIDELHCSLIFKKFNSVIEIKKYPKRTSLIFLMILMKSISELIYFT